MALPTSVDFDKGKDFTAVNPATGADLNQVVDLAVPHAEDVDFSEGKGLILTTRDNFDGTPCVPNATVTIKRWSMYLWRRIPYNDDSTPKIYQWDWSKAPDATYLKWIEINNSSSTEAAIDALEADVALLQAQQANTSTQLNGVTSQSNANAAAILVIQGQIPDLLALQDAVNTTLPAADTANALAAAAALAAAQAAQATANSAANNANNVAPASFKTSADYAVVDGPIANEVHNLGAMPKFVRWVMVAQNPPDTGFTAGDEVDVACFCMQDQQFPMFTYGATATTLFITKSTASGDESVVRRDTGATLTNIDASKWMLRCYAWK